MTISQILNILGLALGATLLTLVSGCSDIPALDNLASMQGQPASTDNVPVFDGVGPSTQTQATVAVVKLPAKDPHLFNIGVVLPTDPKHLATAKSLHQGLDLAVADMNAAGGINGQTIHLDVLDSSPAALTALRDRGESVILVGDAALAIDQAAQLANYPQLIGFLCDYVSVPKLTPKNGVRIYLNGDQEAQAMVNYLQSAGVDHVTIAYTNDLAGESDRQYTLYLVSSNHNVASVAESYSPGEHDFALLAKAVYRSGNDALIMAGDGFEYPDILTAFDSVGWKGIVLGYAGNSGLAPLAGAGELAQKAAYPLPEFATNPRSTDAGRVFADKYQAKYGEAPGLPAAYAYDNIGALAAAATQAASNDPMKIRAAFIALRNYVGAAGRYDIKDDGDTEMPLRLWTAGGQPAPEVHSPAPASTPAAVEKLPLSGLSIPGQP